MKILQTLSSKLQRIRHHIAKVGWDRLRRQLENAWSASYQQDGSVDLRQHDNEFHSASRVDWNTLVTNCHFNHS